MVISTEDQENRKKTITDDEVKEIISFPPQIHWGYHFIPKQDLFVTLSDVIHLLASI
jgi:hypothetical protein